LAHLLTDGRFAAKPTKELQTQWQNNGDEMNQPTLQGFRRSLQGRISVAQREIARQSKRKNYRAEYDRLIALQMIVLLDEYIKKSEGEFE
jgi:hypothetical protein